jgi:hypothetical protein
VICQGFQSLWFIGDISIVNEGYKFIDQFIVDGGRNTQMLHGAGI